MHLSTSRYAMWAVAQCDLLAQLSFHFACRTVNPVVKQCIQWRRQQLPDLTNKLRNFVRSQYIRRLIGRCAVTVAGSSSLLIHSIASLSTSGSQCQLHSGKGQRRLFKSDIVVPQPHHCPWTAHY